MDSDGAWNGKTGPLHRSCGATRDLIWRMLSDATCVQDQLHNATSDKKPLGGQGLS